MTNQQPNLPGSREPGYAQPLGPILLTGPGGQVGWELSRSLQSLGQVVAVSRQSGCDLSQPEQIRDVVRRVKPRLIVNAAAYTAVDRAESEPELAMAVNGIAPGILAEEARRAGACLVHYSTDYVYGGEGTTAWQEDDPTGPQNTYGRTKLAGEEAIRAVGVPHLILRTSWVFGLHGANFVKTMLRVGAQRETLSVVDDQIGAPTSARVIADVTGLILTQGLADLPAMLNERGGVVHLACGGETSWHGFAEAIFDIARQRDIPLAVQELRPIATSDYPTPAHRPHNSRLQLSRLRERFGLVPPDWRVALEQSFPHGSAAVGQASSLVHQRD